MCYRKFIMKTINIKTEWVLDMIAHNEEVRLNSLSGNYGRIIITPLGHTEYVYPIPGTHYPNCDEINPEKLLNVDEINKDYSLDIVDFQTVAEEIVRANDEDSDDIYEHIIDMIDEWKTVARSNTKSKIEIIADGTGKLVNTYIIEWV